MALFHHGGYANAASQPPIPDSGPGVSPVCSIGNCLLRWLLPAGPGAAGFGNRDGGTATVVVRTIGVRVSQLHLPKTLTVPVCGWCGRSMVLTRTAVEPKGFEMRSFECPDCDHVVIERVSTDPMETGKGWVEGELRPPG